LLTSLEVDLSIQSPDEEMMGHVLMILLVHYSLEEMVGELVESIPSVREEAVAGVFVPEIVFDPIADVLAGDALGHLLVKVRELDAEQDVLETTLGEL
jgi:hypothetical protein